MPKFQFNKLVRDKMPGMYEEIGQKAKLRKLSGDGLRIALLEKIIEEARELIENNESSEEIADIQQALNDLKDLCGVSEEEITEIMATKRAKKGGFAEGYYVETLELRGGDEWIKYYRNEPKKYLEIFTNGDNEQFDFPEIETGRYIHTKSGKEYDVLGVACHSETLEPLVVYKPLYEHEGLPDIWVRPYEMFFEKVEIDGERRARFEKIESDETKKDT